MNSETRQCQNCKKSFTIEPDDFGFYEQMKVPAPTWCPECRFQRRLSFANERHLYKNTCGLCGKHIVAMYPSGTPFPVYCFDCYRGDKWDPLSYGTPYDFNRPFFEQFKELKLKVPRAERVQQGDAMGSEYCNRASYNKNCYQVVRANYNEDSFYSYTLSESQDCMDCFNVDKSQLAYECIDCIGCYQVQYCREARQCRNSYFLFDCRNCNDCVGCTGLRNKQYYILNQPYSKQEYEKKIKELKLDTREGIAACAAEFEKLVKKTIREPMIETNCIKSSGNWLTDCKDVKDSYQSRGVERGKNLLMIFNSKDCMDYSYWGRNCELIYETGNCGYDCSRMRFINECWNACHDLTCCDNCYSSSNLFGCVGLRNKEYCILNVQYSKEEYEKMVPKIIEHMNTVPWADKKGRIYKFGEFFPSELSPSAYNTTVAQEHFPLTRKEAVDQGYAWEDTQQKNYEATRSWKDLMNDIASAPDDITKEIILCRAWDESGGKSTEEHNCTKAFRITPGELSFYRKLNIPLPQECLNTRHFKRLKKRNPLRLWHRKCQCVAPSHFHAGRPCPNEFETSYAPEPRYAEGSRLAEAVGEAQAGEARQPEVVYCEHCYQAEVI